MAKISYEQARADHDYLWKVAPAADMTGGYVDQDDLKKLLQNPTKATARDCYIRQIHYWFQVGPEDSEVPWQDPRVHEIAVRHSLLDKDEDDDA